MKTKSRTMFVGVMSALLLGGALSPSIAYAQNVVSPVVSQVQAETVTVNPVMETLVRLVPHQETMLSAEMAGRIDVLPLKEGAGFKAGDMLVQFNCAVENSNLAKARALYSAALKKLKVVRGLRKYNSSTDLEIQMAEAETAKAKADVNVGKAVVSKCTLQAPFDGKIAELSVHAHQFASVGTKLMHIIDDTVLEVEFLAPSSWMRWLKTGRGFQVHVGETDSLHPAEVIRIGAKVDPVSHSVKVVGRLTQLSPELRAGMTGNAAFALDEAP